MPGIAILVVVVFTPAALTATTSGYAHRQADDRRREGDAIHLSVAMTIPALVVLSIVAAAFVAWLFVLRQSAG